MALVTTAEIDSLETTVASTADRAAGQLAALIGARSVSDARRANLARAIELGASSKSLGALLDASRISRHATIGLPQGRFATKSRGKGWCREGSGTGAQWHNAEDGVHIVGPGKYVVGSNDGFSRKEQTPWTVKHVQVGSETWTIAI